ncbi:MAG TPA: chromosome segregation protein SMC [Dissulfurispiraceae bacterium]|nr:chromosome segregation protein SMC [Dissulfurispiraceae bacterium]
MKIKEIDLVGFKSFGDKTTLYLHDGITCIVGPNGCGKSNVVDAFRWVLGEQSAKSLRGEKMEEVIFQGTATKKSKGMAEVRLVISTAISISKEAGDGDATEDSTHDKIEVARRLYRSGESEYVLNKRSCRLKDIRDIFLDTGLDVKSYSILDQGRIAEILNTKPIDRRFLIEEVAGVMKYKVRRAEALSKLSSSKENLQRINDITVEVRRQINSLDRLVKKAERYKRLLDEFREIDLRTSKRDYLGLNNILEALNAEIARLREELSLKRSEFSTLESSIASKRIEILEKEKVLAELENRLNEKARSISELEKESAVLKNVVDNKKEDISRLYIHIEEMDSKKESLLNQVSELDDGEKSLAAKIDEMNEGLKEKKDWAAGIETAIVEKEEELEDRRKELFRISDTISGRRNDLHKLQSSLETLNYRESSSLHDKESISRGLEESDRIITALSGDIEGRKGEIAKLDGEKEALNAEIVQLSEEIENKKSLLSREKEELAGNLSRLESIKELIVDKSLYEFLAESEESKHLSPAILSNIISAGKDYEAAVESALSEKINSLIIDRIDDVFAAIAIIKEKGLGKTSILYTDLCRISDDESRPLTSPELSLAPGIVGRASEFINFENTEARDIACSVLSNVLVVRDLSSGLSLRKDALYRSFSFVTLAGELITPDGFISAGKGKDILKRKREIRELQKEIENRQSQIARIDNDILAAGDILASKKEELRSIETAVINLETEISLSRQSLQGKNEEIERFKRRLSFLETELAAITADKESLNVLISSKTDEIGNLDSERNVLNDGISALQESLSAVRGEYDAERSQLAEMRSSLAAYREKLEALKKERATIAATIEELDTKKIADREDIRIAEEKIASAVAEMAKLEEAVKIFVMEAGAIEKERSEKREVINAENLDLVTKDEVLKGFRAVIDDLSQELSDNNTKFAENKVRVENIETSITQKYNVDVRSEEILVADFDPEADEKKMAELNETIQAMGPVNVGAIEEYEELKTRYDFLSKQQQDLTLSIAELEEAITRINATTRRKLREAYDMLREKFQEVFTGLFGGGRADIILTDEGNILESGIDIIAQPPGKKLQNINLLSGGEKALTSLSLLFAGFLIKPSPLCILDEADAPLDESNTVRFAQLIKSLAGDTQFLIITHNRATMEAADYLYGITMEDPGNSKAISLRFSEAENIPAV